MPRGQQEREAFQEIDYRRMFGQMTKWVAQIDDASRIPEMVARAFRTATSGRPGPVVLALPEDMLRESAEVADSRPYQSAQAHPGAEDLAEMRDLLIAAKRPLMILGGGDWNPQAWADIRKFAESWRLPTAVAFRRQDLFDNRHPCYQGDVAWSIFKGLRRQLDEADLLLVAGARLNEGTTGRYGLLTAPRTGKTLIHVYASAEELGRVYEPDLAIQASAAPFAAAAARLDPPADPVWAAWCAAGHQAYLRDLEARPLPGPIDMNRIMAFLRQRLPRDAVLTSGAGNFSDWPNKYFDYGSLGGILAPISGAMGYGVPAAVAAKIAFPERMVLGFCGDGDFLMTGQELATAVHAGVSPIFIVINNNMYGTIRMHQERRHPGRECGTDLSNPDFAALARAFGAEGEVVETTDAFPDAFERAVTCGKPALLELRVDPDAALPTATLSELRGTLVG